MSDDIKLSEDASINLDEQPLDGDINLPKSDDSDFDLDKFLAENAVEDTADVDLNLAQDDTDFAGLFDDKETAEVADVSLDDLPEVNSEKEENELAAEPEVEPIFEDKSEVEAESEVLTEEVPEIQNEEISDPEEENIIETDTIDEDEPANSAEENLEDAEENSMPEDESVEMSFDETAEHTEEDVVNGNASKGWDFEGIDDVVAGSEEDEALNMSDDEGASFEIPVPEDIEPGSVQTKDVATDSYINEDVVEAPIDANVEQESRADADHEQEPADVEAVSLNSQQTVYDLQEENGYARWYSGNYDDQAFEVDKQSVSGVLDGDDEHKVIHVNVGYDTYGWLVEFTNDVVMNLRDVREYQLKNGALPAKDGAIVYGDMRIEFHHIEKITLYESVRYFTYMPN